MNWRYVCVWMKQYAIRSVTATLVAIGVWMITILLSYYWLYMVMNSTYLFLLVNDPPMWLKLYCMVGTSAVVYYACEFLRQVLARYLLGCLVVYFLLQPFTFFVADVLLCEYRRRSRVPMKGHKKWKSCGNLPFFDTDMRRVGQVKICAADPLNNPFWPECVSIVHLVEVRIWDHLTNWYELTIWRVSTISGHREKIHIAQLVKPGYQVPDRLKCFEGRGLIAVVLATSAKRNSFLLYLYDTHFDRSVVYQCAQSFSVTRVDKLAFIAISCQARLFDQQQRLNGWKIRLIHCDKDPGHAWHDARMVNSVLEFGEKCRLISQEEITSKAFSSSVWLPIRSSDGNSVGMYCKNVQTQNGRVFLYNLSTRKYTWTTYRRFRRRDRKFAATKPRRSHDLYPIVLNPRQCIKFSPRDGMIYTMRFAGQPVATLRLQAARALIRSNRAVREMDQEQFRRLTGVGPMGVRPHSNQWPTVISYPPKVSF